MPPPKRLRPGPGLAVLLILGATTMGSAPAGLRPEAPTAGDPSRTFQGVNRAVWRCVQAATIKEHETVYSPEEAARGTATTDTPVGLVILDWDLDEAGQELRYTLRDKPFIITEGQVWGGIRESIEDCQR